LKTRTQAAGFRFIAPPFNLCTDNAAMIAWAGAERMAAGLPASPLDLAPRSRWPLDQAGRPQCHRPRQARRKGLTAVLFRSAGGCSTQRALKPGHAGA
jgi:hypothetical protein